MNRRKSSVRFKAEHSIGVIKRVFWFQKARCRAWPITFIGCGSPLALPTSSEHYPAGPGVGELRNSYSVQKHTKTAPRLPASPMPSPRHDRGCAIHGWP
jgi:hypothetical protein